MFLYKVTDKEYANIDLITTIRFLDGNLWMVDFSGQTKGLLITEYEKNNLVAIMEAHNRRREM